jgi:hypothetical protein
MQIQAGPKTSSKNFPSAQSHAGKMIEAPKYATLGASRLLLVVLLPDRL